MAKKRKLNLKRIAILITTVLIFFALLIFIASLINRPKNSEVVDEIENYGYTIKENASSYYKELFSKLKDAIVEDETEYAKLVGQLFLTDFYTLDNKINKNDIGGVEFVYSGYQEEFISYASTTPPYTTIINSLIGKRNQQLPIVKEVTVKNMVQKEFGHKDSIYDLKAFFIDYKIEYVKDLEYPVEVTLIIVREDNKLSIVEMQTVK
jgi:hypothetical protein